MKKSNKIMLLALLILQTKTYCSAKSDLDAQENKHRTAAEMLKVSTLEQYDNKIQQLDKTSPNFETEKNDLNEECSEKLSHIQSTLVHNIQNLDAAPCNPQEEKKEEKEEEASQYNNLGSKFVRSINLLNYLKSK